jgi:peptidoglycan lytic transglycosylase
VSGVGQLKPAGAAGGLGVFAGLSAPFRLAASLLLIASLASGVASCRGGNGEGLGERVIPLGQPVPKGGGVYHIGSPYQVAGLTYTPREDPGYDRIGRASWYGELFHGRRTANGEIYDMERLSAAHPTLPLPVYAQVTNLANGRTIIVRVNDRGPYARDRIIDLSRRSAELLGFRSNGTADVRVRYLGHAPLSGDDSYERRYMASQSWIHVASNSAAKRNAESPIAVGSVPDADTLPAENPENLAFPWKEAAPPDNGVAHADPAPPGWQASPRWAPLPAGAPTGSIAPPAKAKPQSQGLLIQAGSFKSRENANRASVTLGSIALVDVAPIEVGGEVYFRVRVGPFSDEGAAQSALFQVTKTGYQGAKIVTRN